MYKLLFFEDHIIIQCLISRYIVEREFKAYKLVDISEKIFEKLDEDQIESIYHFFFDLETKEE
jgi:hypothetical protein